MREKPIALFLHGNGLFDVISSLLFSVFLKNIFFILNLGFVERDLQWLWQLSQSNKKHGMLLIKSKLFRHLCIHLQISEKHWFASQELPHVHHRGTEHQYSKCITIHIDAIMRQIIQLLIQLQLPTEESFCVSLLSNMNIWVFNEFFNDSLCCTNTTALIV